MSFRLTGRVRGLAADELVTGLVWHWARGGHKGDGTVPQARGPLEGSQSVLDSSVGSAIIERHPVSEAGGLP
jgi:hypothetical protein